MRIVIESHVAAGQLSLFFDINLLRPINHHLADIRVVKQSLDRSIPRHIVQYILKDAALDIFRQTNMRLLINTFQILFDKLTALFVCNPFAFDPARKIVNQEMFEFGEIGGRKL